MSNFLLKFFSLFSAFLDLGTYYCVLFIDNFKYDVVNERHIERSSKAIAKASKPEKGELLKASGYLAKVFKIGRRLFEPVYC